MADNNRRANLRRIAVTGSSGFIGGALVSFLRDQGDEVIRVPRTLEGSFEGLDAVIHLAGRPIFARWTETVKREIYESRVKGTERLAEQLQRCKKPPRVLICASAVGIYGDRGEEVLTEGSHVGRDFLADVARKWEAAARAPLRVVNARFGLVMGREGGLFSVLRPLYEWGLGGPIGSGRQWVSWVALHDLVRALDWAIETPELSGPINVVAPHPMRQSEFARSLSRALVRPCWLRLPEWAVKAVLGEMGRTLLLSSQRVLPHKLEESGFRFCKPTLDAVLKDILPI